MAVVAIVCLQTTSAESPPPTRWWEAAKAAEPEVIDTLHSLVDIDSGSRDLEGLAKMASTLEKQLQSLGLKTERKKTTVGPGAETVIGSMEGKGKLRVMLQAHMDTVYAKGILHSQPYRRDGARLYGPGIADDKGGIAVILHGLKILRDSGWADFSSLTVLFNPDEEIGSPGSGELISSLAERNDVVLSFEPNEAKDVSGNESLVLGTAGVTRIVMKVAGRPSHAGIAPEQGRNALVELAHQIVETRNIATNIVGGQLNWTGAATQNANNQIPEMATATADVRSRQPGADAEILKALEAQVRTNRLIPDTEISFDMQRGRPLFVANPRGRALGEMAQRIYREIGCKLDLKHMVGGGTDAAFASLSGKPAVIEGLGLPGYGYHARDEYIETDGIAPRLYLVVRILVELGKQPYPP